MNLSVYDEIIKYRNLPEEELFEKLSETTGELFMPLLEIYPGIAKNIVGYIVDGYSVESPHMLLKNNWGVRKKELAIKHLIPDHKYGEIVELEGESIRNVIAEYLEYQGDLDFKHLRMLEDLYEKMMSAAYTDVFDIKVLNENRESLSSLRNDINDLKKELYEKYHVFFDNIGEVRSKEKVVPQSLRNLATSPLVKKT